MLHSAKKFQKVYIELTLLDVTMVCMDCQADGNNENISKSKVMEKLYFNNVELSIFGRLSSGLDTYCVSLIVQTISVLI